MDFEASDTAGGSGVIRWRHLMEKKKVVLPYLLASTDTVTLSKSENGVSLNKWVYF